MSATDVWAVGASFDVTRNMYRPLMEHWNGVSWTVVNTPNAGSTYDQLNAVKAVSANDVWAVGLGDAGTLTEHWDGKTWKIVPSPNDTPWLNTSWLTAITARGPNDVWAVGISFGAPLIEHWDGGAWTIVASPPPQGSWDALLTGVTAVSSSDAWAVGYSDLKCDPRCDAAPFAEHWDGTAWTAVALPGHGVLNSVTAISTNDVWAVGGPVLNVGDATARPIVDHWDGTAWTAVPTPSPAPIMGLSSVAAVAPNDIWTVGSSFLTNPFVVTPVMPPYPVIATGSVVIEHWNGATWSTVPSVSPPNGGLASVAVVSPTDIWAVGETFVPPFGPDLALTEHYVATACPCRLPAAWDQVARWFCQWDGTTLVASHGTT